MSGGTNIYVKHACSYDITLASQCSLLASDPGGRYATIRLHRKDKSLLLIGAYWPSGSSQDALTCRQDIQNLFTSMINIDKNCTPILIGDMNASAYPHDHSSVKTYEADTMYRDFLDTNNLAPLSHAPNIQRPWTHCQAFRKDQFESTIYSFGRVHDILLPANLAAQCHPCQTVTKASVTTYLCWLTFPRTYQCTHSPHCSVTANAKI